MRRDIAQGAKTEGQGERGVLRGGTGVEAGNLYVAETQLGRLKSRPPEQSDRRKKSLDAAAEKKKMVAVKVFV